MKTVLKIFRHDVHDIFTHLFVLITLLAVAGFGFSRASEALAFARSNPVALALGLSGLVTFWPWEILLLLLYGLSCAGFAEVLRGLLGTAGRLGAALPLVLLAGLALCPIFLNVHRLPAVQILLPPFYYLNGAHSGRFAAYLALYTVMSWGLGLVLQRIRKQERTEA